MRPGWNSPRAFPGSPPTEEMPPFPSQTGSRQGLLNGHLPLEQEVLPPTLRISPQGIPLSSRASAPNPMVQRGWPKSGALHPLRRMQSFADFALLERAHRRLASSSTGRGWRTKSREIRRRGSIGVSLCWAGANGISGSQSRCDGEEELQGENELCPIVLGSRVTRTAEKVVESCHKLPLLFVRNQPSANYFPVPSSTEMFDERLERHTHAVETLPEGVGSPVVQSGNRPKKGLTHARYGTDCPSLDLEGTDVQGFRESPQEFFEIGLLSRNGLAPSGESAPLEVSRNIGRV